MRFLCLQDLPAQAGEIPVIEENYSSSPTDGGKDGSKTISFDDGAADEIDIKDIPF